METRGHLIVDVARLDAAGESFAGETDDGSLDLDVAPLCQPQGGIRYDVHVEQIDRELLARGRVAQTFQCRCSRCAEPFALEVVEPHFFADYPAEAGTEYVDLTPEMREAIILALPGYPVCRDDCRGLCARCGANLNSEPCTCKPASGEPWAGLDVLGKV